MPLKEDAVKELTAPLHREHVKQREQGKSKVSYIEGWHVIAEANRIFGFDAWTRETVDIKCVSERPRKIHEGKPYEKDGFGVTYTARVRVTVEGIVREGVGAGHGIDVDPGQAHESAIKEAETDAMKRAFMTFGNPFGLALYDKAQTNVEGGNARANPPPAPAAAPAQKYVLTDPETGSVEEFEKPGPFMAALTQKMRSDDPAFWWGPNADVAKRIAEQFPQGKADYDALHQMVVGVAA